MNKQFADLFTVSIEPKKLQGILQDIYNKFEDQNNTITQLQTQLQQTGKQFDEYKEQVKKDQDFLKSYIAENNKSLAESTLQNVSYV
jgi:peptidoglycan hydrolase CwlO-like protein